MKVTQGEVPKKFEPITIVLETEGEAKVMWFALCAKWSGVCASANCEWAEEEELRDINVAMFSSFADVYNYKP